jgi:hypothetical protein
MSHAVVSATQAATDFSISLHHSIHHVSKVQASICVTCRELMAERPGSKVLVVVPTVALTFQHARSFVDYGVAPEKVLN